MSTWNVLEKKDELTQSELLAGLIDEADAIVAGIGAGMSAAAGFVYTGPRFKDNFPDFIEKYNFFDMLQAFVFMDWETPEEMWAFKSRFNKLNYFDQSEGLPYTHLREVLESRNYHVITTNADTAFYRSNYNMDKVFRCQGEYGLMQCYDFCHQQAYPISPEWNQEMVDKQDNMEIPTEIMPRCPRCGQFMEINKRDTIRDMVEDYDFHRQRRLYESFLADNHGKKVLYLESGVGTTTPQFIRDPFQDMTGENENAVYVTMNRKPYRIKEEARERTVRITEDIAETFAEVHQLLMQ